MADQDHIAKLEDTQPVASNSAVIYSEMPGPTTADLKRSYAIALPRLKKQAEKETADNIIVGAQNLKPEDMVPRIKEHADKVTVVKYVTAKILSAPEIKTVERDKIADALADTKEQVPSAVRQWLVAEAAKNLLTKLNKRQREYLAEVEPGSNGQLVLRHAHALRDLFFDGHSPELDKATHSHLKIESLLDHSTRYLTKAILDPKNPVGFAIAKGGFINATLEETQKRGVAPHQLDSYQKDMNAVLPTPDALIRAKVVDVLAKATANRLDELAKAHNVPDETREALYHFGLEGKEGLARLAEQKTGKKIPVPVSVLEKLKEAEGSETAQHRIALEAAKKHFGYLPLGLTPTELVAGHDAIANKLYSETGKVIKAVGLFGALSEDTVRNYIESSEPVRFAKSLKSLPNNPAVQKLADYKDTLTNLNQGFMKLSDVVALVGDETKPRTIREGVAECLGLKGDAKSAERVELAHNEAKHQHGPKYADKSRSRAHSLRKFAGTDDTPKPKHHKKSERGHEGVGDIMRTALQGPAN